MRTLIWALALAWPLAGSADYKAGADAFGRGDLAAALSEWKPLAEQGHAAAQINLGAMYLNGHGVARDDAEAMKWFRLAAAQGRPIAQFNIGYMYESGRGVAKDGAEALKWYRMAAEQGLARAQYNLGVLYASGEGVAQDYVRGYAWLTIAAAGRDRNALQTRELVVRNMEPAQVAQAEKLGRELCARIPKCAL
jgi:TPR repeat protein